MHRDELKEWTNFASAHNFSRRINGAETHFYFIEGAHAFEEKLYIAACLCFLNGIESSIRTILMYLSQNPDTNDLVGKTLSNALLLSAKQSGLNVDILAFPNESNFLEKIKTKKPDVEIVRTRNNICHGNIFEYIQKIPETEERIFSPECMASVAALLKSISESWSKEIYRFKREYEKA